MSYQDNFISEIEDEEIKDFLKNYLKENSLKIIKKKQISKKTTHDYERCLATTKAGNQCKRKKGKNVPTRLCMLHYKDNSSIDMDVDEPQFSDEETVVCKKEKYSYEDICEKIECLEL